LPIVSEENEISAWEHIEKYVDKAFKKYPTTIEDDEFILDQDYKK